MSRKDKLFDFAEEMGIKIINAKNGEDSNRIAIHLLNPSIDDFEDALMTAERDNFPAIVIHNNSTWNRS